MAFLAWQGLRCRWFGQATYLEGNGNVWTEPRGATMVFNTEVVNGYRDDERTLLANMAS